MSIEEFPLEEIPTELKNAIRNAIIGPFIDKQLDVMKIMNKERLRLAWGRKDYFEVRRDASAAFAGVILSTRFAQKVTEEVPIPKGIGNDCESEAEEMVQDIEVSLEVERMLAEGK